MFSKSKIVLIAVTGIVVATTSLAHGGHGGSSGGDSSDDDSHNSSGSSSNQERTRIRASFVDAAGITTEARGRVRRDYRLKDDRERDRFTSKIVIPIPSTTPVVADATAAEGLSLSVTLSRTGIAYARCGYEFDQIELDDNEDDGSQQQVAEYKVDIRSRTRPDRNRLTQKKGYCDVDLVTDGIQVGVPELNQGDTAEVIDEATQTVFLSATL